MRALRAAALAAVVLLLSGCAEIPTSGPVNVGPTERPNDPSIVIRPNPPSAGATQEEIVDGFISAASAGGDLHVAREFLTADAASAWKPEAQVLVHSQALTTTTPHHSSGDVRVDVPVTARVDANGTYTPTTRSMPIEFHLVRVAGQWRIDRAPDGIVLIQSVFQSNYSPPRLLEYFDPPWNRLVPDLRWFPRGGSATAIVRALIAGPSALLAGGVTQNALGDVQVRSVSASDSGTSVILSRPSGAPDAATLTRMQLQLSGSLQVPLPQLHLFVNGRSAPQAKPLTSGLTTLQPFVLAGGRFGTLQQSNGQVVEDRTLGKRIAALKPTAVTVSVRQQRAAVVSDGRLVLVTAAGDPRKLDRPLVAPAVDQTGWTYSVSSDEPHGLTAFSPKGVATRLDADLGAGTVLAIEVSPDGTRLLVLMRRASGPAAFVAGIERAQDGTPTGLTVAQAPVDPGAGASDAVDATWVDDYSVAVLTRSQDGQTERVTVQQLGGLSSSLGQLANATSIVGTSGKETLRVRLRTGDIAVWRSNAWQSEFSGSVDVSVLAVQR